MSTETVNPEVTQLMKCTECNEAIPFWDEDVTVHVVYGDGRGIERHCHHNPFDETDPAIIAILGSLDCADRWIRRHREGNGNVN